MNRKFFLSIAVTSTLLFSQVSAQSPWSFTPTCKYFGFLCGASTQNTNQESYSPTPTTGFSFANFFDSWKNPWASDNFQPVNTQTPGAQTGGVYTPSPVVGVDKGNGVLNATDFGVRSVKENAVPVLKSDTQMAAEKNLFDTILDCSQKSDPSCANKIAEAKAQTDTIKTPNISSGQTTPGSENGGTQTNDNLVGTQSPNYDSGEDNHIDSGPLQRGVEDSQIKQSAQSFDGSKYFVNRGTGSCANFGIDVGGSCPDVESYKDDFKSAVSNLCSNLTGKRLKITSGNRSEPCNRAVKGASGSSHMSGLAMDTRLDNYSGDEKVLVVMYLAAQGFNNFGGYGSNAAMHFDMRSSVNRWGPNYSISTCEAKLFPDYFRKAMAIMGSEPCQRDYQLKQKAINALIKMGKEKFTIPANTSAAQ